MAKKDSFDSLMSAYGDNHRTLSRDLVTPTETQAVKQTPEVDLTIEQKKKLHASRTANNGRKKNNARSTKHQVNFKVEQDLWDEFQEMCLTAGISYSEMIVNGMRRMIEENTDKK